MDKELKAMIQETLDGLDKKITGIEITSDEADEYVCECGNNVTADGFEPCDEKGNIMEPTIMSEWDGLYVCLVCGRIHRIK